MRVAHCVMRKVSDAAYGAKRLERALRADNGVNDRSKNNKPQRGTRLQQMKAAQHREMVIDGKRGHGNQHHHASHNAHGDDPRRQRAS